MSEIKYTPVSLPVITNIPFDPWAFSYVRFYNQYIPHTYTNWREETLSWKTSCYIAAELSVIPFVRLSGPDVIRLLSDISVNSFANFPFGSCKHMIWCAKTGNILFHGLVLRTGEEEIHVYSDSLYLLYHIEKGKYNVKPEMDRPDDSSDWVFQLAGPRCLEILEQAACEDLHDIKFMRFRNATIAGQKIRILRMGMGGSLSYEVHGLTNEAGIEVYNEILRVGQPYGIVKLGFNPYMCEHTENGYPQIVSMFPQAISEDEVYLAFLRKAMPNYDYMLQVPRGSLSTDIKDYYRNPYELGWGHMVKFDHDFIGREALEKIAANHRKLVTLVWNHEDIMKVFASFFEKGEEPYADMPFPLELSINGVAMKNCFQDKVLKGGKMIGVSMWRTYTLYYRETISLCCIDPEYAQIGTDVTLVWGDIGKRQLEIRAKVDRYPYLDLVRNMEFDKETIPHYKG